MAAQAASTIDRKQGVEENSRTGAAGGGEGNRANGRRGSTGGSGDNRTNGRPGEADRDSGGKEGRGVVNAGRQPGGNRCDCLKRNRPLDQPAGSRQPRCAPGRRALDIQNNNEGEQEEEEEESPRTFQRGEPKYYHE